MQKIFRVLSVSVTLLLLFTVSAFADEIGEPTFEPYSPAYLEWLKQHENDSFSPPLLKFGAGEIYSTGYIPFHIDLSHLADNPPIEANDSPVPLLKDTAIPSKYDLRNVNGKSYVTSVKDQNPYGTCWAHASIGAIESNMLMKGLGESDLSEMHLAWFTFKNSDSAKRFKSYQNSSLETVLNLGGNAFYPTTLFSRLSGPTTEAEAPYPTQPSKANPDDYTMAVRLREVYYLAMNDGTINVNSPTTNRDIVKRRIMENGSVMASYYSVDSAYKKTASNGTSYYYSSSSTNHAVQIVGWDDSYSRSNFSPTPSVDGAWLIKNSWGDKWWNGTENVGDDGCFWMSYAQYLTDGTAFIVEKANPDMKVYDYSPLGWGGTWGYSGSKIHTANVFKSERDNEKLTEVGFFTKDNNMTYEINVYTGMSSMPSSSPINGSSVSTMSGTIPYAGWHTVTLNTPVNLTKNQYFSVVVTYTSTGMAPVEMTSGVTANSKTEDGSFFSSNGSSWTTGKSKSLNATIKAYTVTGSSSTGTAPTITTASLPSGKVNQSYSATLEATGTTPITWSRSSGSLPTGLSLDSSTGVISGTPTSAGSYTFSITAANSYGNSTAKSYTVVIEAAGVAPTITTASLPSGKVNQSYSATLEATGTTPITWSVSSGSLPSGLSLDSSTGVISGTPTSAGSYTFSITASNSYGSSTAKSYTVVIEAAGVAPYITTEEIPDGQIGQPYTAKLEATGTAPIKWSLTYGKLPDGLTLNASTGVISGTPTTAGTFIFTITATNDYGYNAADCGIIIYSGTPSGYAPVIMADEIYVPVINQPYEQYLFADGTQPITWSLSGNVPPGLSIASYTTYMGYDVALLSGTVTQQGSYTFTITAKNAYGSDSGTLTFDIAAPQGTPSITTESIVDGYVGQYLSQTLVATSTQTGVFTWTVAEGTLPPGLKLTSYSPTGYTTLYGTPTAKGTYTFTLKVTNSVGSATKTYTMTVGEITNNPLITTMSLHYGLRGDAYRCALKASGTGQVRWTVDSGNLPAGLSLDSATGVISGTPSAVGIYIFTIKATGSSGSTLRSFMLSVFSNTGYEPIIETPSLPDAKVGEAYSEGISACGTSYADWSISSGSLPTGLTLDATTGVISGTPTSAGSYTFTATAANAYGSYSKFYTLKVTGSGSTGVKPTISTASLTNGQANQSYSFTPTATGTSPITWTASGLPSGLSVNSSTGVISGTPTTAGTYSITLTATNTYGSDTKTLTLTVSAAGVKPSITTTSLTNGQANQSYSFTLTATGTSPITWSASGLPSGLSVNSSTGTISGTPSTAGTYSITLTATNTYGSDTKTLTLTVSAAGVKPSITTTSLTNGQANQSYSFTLTATGTSPITWSASGLPSGLSVNSSTGVISGTPRTAGTYRPSITARNAYGNDTKTLTLTIAAAGVRPTITTSTLPEGKLNTAYSQTLSATGTAPITWSISSGTLPAGLSLDSSTGAITGTPTASGTFTFTVMASNAYGTATRSYTVNIVAVLTGDTVSLTGYVGYNLRQLLELPSSQSATWTASGSMPSGISLSRGGLISGRPSRAGNYTVTVTASTSSSRTEFTVNFVINARPEKPTIRLSSFPVAVVDESYSCAVTTTGTAPITLTVTGLPDGLKFSESTATISGTPTKAGTYNVKITAENIATQLDNRPVTKTLRLTVKAQPPEIEDPGTLPDGIMGEPYSNIQFKASKGTEPIVWRISGQPSGMRMDTSGLLSGTPSRAGRFTMTVRASNSGGNTTLRVPITILQKPTVSSARMSMATTDTSYTARFTATGTTPITWMIDGLPDTMRYSQNDSGTTATITGIPVVAGEYSVKLTLSNVAGSRDYTVNFRVRGVAPRLTATLTRATTGQSYRGSRIYATGTKPIEISYSISDSDKARFGITGLEDLGLSFTCNSADGTAEITGTPSISFKNLPITFTAKNSTGTATRRVNFTSAGTTPRFTSPSESTVNILCKVGSPVNVDFTVEGSKNITYSMNSVSGFTLTQTGDYTATLSGTAPARDTTTNITITATNADGRATKRVMIRTQTPPTITTASLPAGRLNTNYSTRVTATGTSTIRWTIEGTLPRGLRFSSGSFSGRPTEAGDFPVTIKAANTIGEDSKSFTISIADPNAVRSVATSQEATVEEYTPSSQTSYVPETSAAIPEISAETRAINVGDGCIIAARLPEVSVDVSGMYDFEAELSENAPVGARLYWLAYPDGEGSDDDEIAEFYDETGGEIDAVPEGRRISVSVWLNEGVKYSPVIAVK